MYLRVYSNLLWMTLYRTWIPSILCTWSASISHTLLSRFTYQLSGTCMSELECISLSMINLPHICNTYYITLKGIQKCRTSMHSPKIQLPITLHIMANIKSLMSKLIILTSWFGAFLWPAKFLWLPQNVRTPKYSYLQALLEKHAIGTW